MPIQPLLMNEHNGHLQSLDNHTQKKPIMVKSGL